MKHNLEGDTVYLNSMAFFLDCMVAARPPRGNSHNSIAFCWSSLNLSESLKDMSYSIISWKVKLLTRILLLINDDITGQQDVLVVSGEDLLDLEPLEAFHLELNVVAGEEVREESLLVNDPHQCPIEVEGVIGLTLPADYPEVSLVEAF